MDGSGERHKEELERECEVEPGLFGEVAERMEEFMRPFMDNYPQVSPAGIGRVAKRQNDLRSQSDRSFDGANSM